MSESSTDSLFLTTSRPPVEPISEELLHVNAPAKINLNLLVGHLGPDGYHPVDSVVAKVTLYDDILLRLRNDGRIIFTCDGYECGEEENNLAFRAAGLLGDLATEAGNRIGGADIHLQKHIPPGGGMGGASSDAACTLLGLNLLWGLDARRESLDEIARLLGSDVPLFLSGPASRMTGRGEILEPITTESFLAVLYLPGIHCPTKDVYAAFDRRPTEIGKQLPDELWRERTSVWRSRLVNQLAEPAMRVRPELQDEYDQLCEATDLPVSVTGSGSGMFILCDHRAEAVSVLDRLSGEQRNRCRVVRLNSW